MFIEDALFVGFVVPGETVAILGGVAASLGHVPLWAVLTVVVVGGDRRRQRRVRGRPPARHQAVRPPSRWCATRDRLDDARDLLARRGGWAVVLGRWVAFFRAVMPALAGPPTCATAPSSCSTRWAACCGAPPWSWAATSPAPRTGRRRALGTGGAAVLVASRRRRRVRGLAGSSASRRACPDGPRARMPRPTESPLTARDRRRPRHLDRLTEADRPAVGARRGRMH